MLEPPPKGTPEDPALLETVQAGEEVVSGHEETLAADLVSGETLAAGPPGRSNVGGPGGVDARYRVVRELGRGGMGRVLLVQDARIRRQVALKDLLEDENASSAPGPSRPSARVNRFLREVRLSGHLEHPSIVPIYDQGEVEGRPYYTMRYVQGRAFNDALRACTGLGERLALLPHFRDVCNAMAYAHSRGIIHRDLKPANVILGEFGETMVVDWGLARMKGDSDEADRRLAEELRHLQQDVEDSQTVFGTALGTPAYMAPEQALGQLDQIDHQSDIYSLGAMLYELLTGRVPISGGPLHQLLFRVVTEPIVPVRDREPGAPAELAAIAERALRKEKATRYATCTDLTADLSAWLSGEKVSSYTYSNWELLRRFVRRNRALVAAATLALVALIATVAFTTRAWRQESRALEQMRSARDQEALARRQAQERKEQAEASLAQKTVEERRANHRMAEAFLARAEHLFEGKFYLDTQVYAAAAALHHPGNPRGPHHHPGFCGTDPGCLALTARAHGLLLNARTRSAYVYDRTIVSDRLGAFRRTLIDIELLHPSPDGRYVVPTLAQKELPVLEVATGREVLTLKGLTTGLAQVSFDAAGGRILAVDAAGDVTAWEFPSGKLQFQAPAGLKDCFFLEPLPGTADLIAATRDGRLFRLDPERREWRSIGTKGLAPLHNVVISPSGRRLVTITPDRPLRLLDLGTGTWRDLEGKTPVGTYAAFSTGEESLVVQFSMSNILRTYGAPDWRTIHEAPLLRDDGGTGYTGFWPSRLPDDTVLGRASNAQVHLLRAGDQQVQQRFHAWGPLSILATTPRNLFVLGSISEILVYDRFPFRQRLTMATLDGRIGLIQPLDEHLTVIGSWSGAAGVHDSRSGVFTPVGSRRSGYVWCAALSPDRGTLLVGAFDRTVQVLDHPAGTVRKILPMDAQVTWVRFSADGKRFFVASLERLHTYDTATLRPVASKPILPVFGNGPPVSAHPGKLMWHAKLGDRGGGELVFHVEELETGAVSELVIPGPAVYPYNVMLLRDDWVAYQHHDNCLNLRKLPEEKPRQRVCGFMAPVSTVTVHERADLLLATGDDHTVRLWRLSTGAPLLVIPTMTSQVAALSPDGAFLMIEDGFRVLRLPLDLSVLALPATELLRKAEQSAGLCLEGASLRPFTRCEGSTKPEK